MLSTYGGIYHLPFPQDIQLIICDFDPTWKRFVWKTVNEEIKLLNKPLNNPCNNPSSTYEDMVFLCILMCLL